MIAIAKPNFNVREVFLACISTVNNAAEKAELEDCVDLLELAESDFETKFPTAQIHLIQSNLTVQGNIGKKEMTIVYDYRMVRPKMPGNIYYDKIKSSAAFGKCPLCSVRTVDTLDHYLPKSKFPIYAVTPITLIPACTPCNIGKHIEFPESSGDQTLHPYYDVVDNVTWLQAEVIQSNPITFDFSVVSHDTWDETLSERATNHFNAFELNELFASHANEEFRGSRKHFAELFRLHPDELKAHLKSCYDSRLELGLNSWQALMYKAMLDDIWFCSGGFIA